MNDNRQAQDTLRAQGYKSEWLARNRGVLSQVAKQLGISPQAVGKVWRGEGRNKRVERVLRRLRAPGFESKPCVITKKVTLVLPEAHV